METWLGDCRLDIDDYLMALKYVSVRCRRALVRRQVGGRDGAAVDDSSTHKVISRIDLM